MKKILSTLLISSLSLSAFSQSFLRPGKNQTDNNLILHNPAKGFAKCLINQNIIYNKTLKISEKHIINLIEEMDKERISDGKSRKLKMLNNLLVNTLLDHILVSKMQESMSLESLAQRQKRARHDFARPMLELEGVTVKIDEEIQEILNKVLTLKKFGTGMVHWIEHEILTEIIKDIIVGTFNMAVSKHAPKLLVSVISGTATNTAIKKALLKSGLHFGKDFVYSLGKGALLEILTYPLHGYAMHPEAEWLELLESSPTLLLNPDWKLIESDPKLTLGHRSVEAWQTHCLAMVRETESVERRFEMMEKEMNIQFYQSLKFIEMSAELDKSDLREKPQRTKRDNTSVSRPRRLDFAK